MRASIDLQFPVPTDAVVRLVNDVEFIRLKAEHVGSRVVQVDVTPGPDGSFTSSVRRTIASDQIPPQVRSFVGNELEIRQTEAWAEPMDGPQGQRHGTVSVEITGAPVRLTGSILLVPTADGSRMTYTGEVKSPIPIFGASIEAAATEAIRSALTQEAAYATVWLAGQEPS
ncbi:Protein of unknown function [Sanguibacter gelidistatuariae]|uniref:DUF2505 domain-containing protein n=1 Tax=Sanguibacter gelidistatuariae TaxID=1814289 RepID=A0A1G6QMX2_9MICO|nr:DUF2505 domain-containing protein [Sanguibacter gelidistatuariae]SDC93086.1 Protein of unknown function [Sanguibacter gelidistatuariae]